jgi:hypothetical protein
MATFIVIGAVASIVTAAIDTERYIPVPRQARTA